MSKRALLVGTCICFLLLTFLSAAYADVPVVTPAEGTIGTTFTITGTDFGSKKGLVFIGIAPCKVLSWSDTSIEAVVRTPIPAGTYDLSLKPKGEAAVILPGAFTIMAPTLEQPGVRPHFVNAGEEVSWGGAFLGAGKGLKKVEVEDLLSGKTKSCRLLDSTMDSITFKLPSGIPGEVNLRYTNGVDTAISPLWGTFAEGPDNPPTLMATYSGYESWANASAVSYRNKLWVFYNHRSSDDYNLAYRIWDGSTWTPGIYVIDANDQYQKTEAQTTPVVVKDVLYLFFTGLGGYLDYTIYNPYALDQTKPWQAYQHIPGVRFSDVTGRFAATYNFTKNQIEVYWTTDNTTILMKTYSLDTGTWSGAKTVNIPRPVGTVPCYFTAVSNQLDGGDYVTYLSWSDKSVGGFLGELKDGVVQQYTGLWYWQSKDSNHGPTLCDLSDRYLAVLTNNWGNQSSYQKYDKTTHTVVGPVSQQGLLKVPFSCAEETNWAPSGVVFSKILEDTDRMDTSFYVFVGDNPAHDQTHWEFVETEYLGYWLPTGKVTHLDFLGNDLPTQEERKQRIAETFSSWPIIGLVDMPPFVLNGHDFCEDCQTCSCTSVEFSFEKASSTGFGGSYSVGAYVETGKKSPVTLDVSAGYKGGFENTTTFKYTQKVSLEGNPEGDVLAFYLVPSFYVHELRWYDFGGAPTGIYTESMEVDTANIVTQKFDPITGPTDLDPNLIPPYLDPTAFPVHAADETTAGDRERLDTYDHVLPLEYDLVVNPSNVWWSPGSNPDYGWEITQENTVDNGFYLKMKMGVEIAKTIGFGMEGELEMHVTTSTETGVEAHSYLKNPGPIDPSDPDRTDQFESYGYWLKPDAQGYWVPRNRKGLGDTPWFITYTVPLVYP